MKCLCILHTPSLKVEVFVEVVLLLMRVDKKNGFHFALGSTCTKPAACLQDFLKTSFKDTKYRNVTHFLLDPSCSSSGMTAEPLEPEIRQLAQNQKDLNRRFCKFYEISTLWNSQSEHCRT